MAFKAAPFKTEQGPPLLCVSTRPQAGSALSGVGCTLQPACRARARGCACNERAGRYGSGAASTAAVERGAHVSLCTAALSLLSSCPTWKVTLHCLWSWCASRELIHNFARHRMDWTDIHYRQLARLITKHTFLYTEMVVDSTLIHNPHTDRCGAALTRPQRCLLRLLCDLCALAKSGQQPLLPGGGDATRAGLGKGAAEQ